MAAPPRHRNDGPIPTADAGQPLSWNMRVEQEQARLMRNKIDGNVQRLAMACNAANLYGEGHFRDTWAAHRRRQSGVNA